MNSGRGEKFMHAKDWHIYAAKLKHQAITYASPSTTIPIIVGAHSLADKERQDFRAAGHAFDDEGANISQLNPFFCELTSVYWLMHNTAHDYVGNAHYRRKWADDDIENSEPGVLYVSDPAYFGCTLREQFFGGHSGFDAPAITISLAERGLLPFSASEMEAVWNQKVFHGCEMVRGPRQLHSQFMNVMFDCLWPIWDEHCEEIKALEGYNRRMMGFVGERMMTGL
jgi:hypothetical protein